MTYKVGDLLGIVINLHNGKSQPVVWYTVTEIDSNRNLLILKCNHKKSIKRTMAVEAVDSLINSKNMLLIDNEKDKLFAELKYGCH